MLVIASDLHLVDGTCAKSISPSAFYVFAERLRELAYQASWRKDNTYRPVEGIDLILLGDALDPLHSTRWLNEDPGNARAVRPWTDASRPEFAAKLGQITHAILETNAEGLSVLKRATRRGALSLPPATRQGRPSVRSKTRIPVPVRVHYTVGNHDWYYHLPGPRFDAIRAEISAALGLSNKPDLFPFDMVESDALREVCARYQVFLRHGDYYDKFNFDRERGRDAATLGDAFAMEVLNRFPVEVHRQLGSNLPEEVLKSLRLIVNVRPVLATSLWIESQIKRHAGSPALEAELKRIWDQVCDEFLQLDFVRQANKPFQFDTVDALKLAVKISHRASFSNINEVVEWMRARMGSGEISYAAHALNEPVIRNGQARFVVYGHTHFHEIVPLDGYDYLSDPESQVYLNSGTWHSYYTVAAKDRARQLQPDAFVPYQAMTYLAFYRDGERSGRSFEAWSGTFA